MTTPQMPYTCIDCQYKIACEKAYGAERDDGDDYRAVIGTHFCRRSWDGFTCERCSKCQPQ